MQDLTAILPSSQDLGSSYRVADSSSNTDTAASDSSGSSADFTSATEKQCPDLAKLSKQHSSSSGAKAKRKFDSATGDSLQVELKPNDKKISDAELSKLVNAVNKCGEISIDVQGNPAKVGFAATKEAPVEIRASC